MSSHYFVKQKCGFSCLQQSSWVKFGWSFQKLFKKTQTNTRSKSLINSFLDNSLCKVDSCVTLLLFILIIYWRLTDTLLHQRRSRLSKMPAFLLNWASFHTRVVGHICIVFQCLNPVFLHHPHRSHLMMDFQVWHQVGGISVSSECNCFLQQCGTY